MVSLKIYTPLTGHDNVPLVFPNGQRYKYPNESFIAAGGIESLIKECNAGQYWNVSDCPEPDDIRGVDISGKKVLFIRQGGLGDISWISRCIYELKRQRGDFDATVSTDSRNQMIFTGSKIAKTVGYPVTVKEFEKADYKIMFSGLIELDLSGTNVFDVYKDYLGLEPFERRPYYVLPKRQKELAISWLKKKTGRFSNQKRVMIHMGASVPWKSWHPKYCMELADALSRLGISVFLAGSKVNWRWQPRNRFGNIFQLCSRPGKDGKNENYWTIDRTVGLLSQMDLLVAPDSGFVHMADALGVPTIAIYGPFPAAAYVEDYPLCKAVQPKSVACHYLPCFPHLHRVCKYMDSAGYSKCLTTITPDMMQRIVLEMLL